MKKIVAIVALCILALLALANGIAILATLAITVACALLILWPEPAWCHKHWKIESCASSVFWVTTTYLFGCAVTDILYFSSRTNL